MKSKFVLLVVFTIVLSSIAVTQSSLKTKKLANGELILTNSQSLSTDPSSQHVDMNGDGKLDLLDVQILRQFSKNYGNIDGRYDYDKDGDVTEDEVGLLFDQTPTVSPTPNNLDAEIVLKNRNGQNQNKYLPGQTFTADFSQSEGVIENYGILDVDPDVVNVKTGKKDDKIKIKIPKSADPNSVILKLSVVDFKGNSDQTTKEFRIEDITPFPNSQDLDGDGLHEDINGDGNLGSDDLKKFDNALSKINVRVTAMKFDFDGDGAIVGSSEYNALKKIIDNAGPTAGFSTKLPNSKNDIYLGDRVTFFYKGSGSGTKGNIKKYEFEIGNKKYVPSKAPFKYKFDGKHLGTPGKVQVELTVTNKKGLKDSSSKSFIVYENPFVNSQDVDNDKLHEDINGDGVLNEKDINEFTNFFNSKPKYEKPVKGIYDFNQDGKTDLQDLKPLQNEISSASSGKAPPKPGTGSSTVSLSSGWNLISAKSDWISNQGSCNINSIYRYDGNKYKSGLNSGLSPFKGVWIDVQNACNLRQKLGPKNYETKLKPGWQIISVDEKKSFNDMNKSCSIVNDELYEYNNKKSSSGYNIVSRTSTLSPEKGYWVELNSKCTLGGSKSSGSGRMPATPP